MANSLTKAKRDLTGVMAQQMAASREVHRIKRDVAEHEGYAVQALEKGDETLALAVAEKIAKWPAAKHIYSFSNRNVAILAMRCPVYCYSKALF